jgi:hypothetical protein
MQIANISRVFLHVQNNYGFFFSNIFFSYEMCISPSQNWKGYEHPRLLLKKRFEIDKIHY